jgi:hypothetical protein
LPILIPALLMLGTTIGAFALQIHGSLTRADPASGSWAPNWIIAGVDAVLVILALYVFAEAWSILRGRPGRPAADAPAAEV